MTPPPEGADRYRHLRRHTVVRLLLTYLIPLVALMGYFHLRYRDLAEEGRRTHLLAVAETQAGTLDLFLRERRANLANVVDDPELPPRPSDPVTGRYLERLRRESPTFVDLGFFDAGGVMVGYAGPYPALKAIRYGEEAWFRKLQQPERRFVVTDMYMGFRRLPHFTIAVRGRDGHAALTVRATLDPERLHDYVRSLRGGGEAASVLVNAAGEYQQVSLPAELAGSPGTIAPPRDPGRGVGRHGPTTYAYCWLDQADWALVVLFPGGRAGGPLAGFNVGLVALSLAAILAVASAIVIRTRSVLRHQREADAAREELSGQLHHAARLASVGELAAGVAHEINNPLAIIAEQAGLIEDLLDPQFAKEPDPARLRRHLRAIREAVFRARDVTHKLLAFVRRSEVYPSRHDVRELVEGAVAGLLEREMRVANIEVVRRYADALPPVLVDGGQIEQVIVNLVTNAIDAMPRGGRLTLATSSDGACVRVAVEDTGVGIAPAQRERLFMPFHTTKEVGKGTGLGLSVSYGIVKSHGGDILVESRPGEGSTFTVVLPAGPSGTSPSPTSSTG
jgi:two-component system NtrC family sensor kinase